VPDARSDRWRWAAPLVVAAVVWLLPHGGFAPRSWGFLCLFAATICSLITRPLPAGSVMVIVIALGMLLRLFTVQDALVGFSNTTVWMIVAAFLFARGFIQTRLGERIAYTIVRSSGRSRARRPAASARS
jgi:DASS family divalent anion:Na+ symporter